MSNVPNLTSHNVNNNYLSLINVSKNPLLQWLSLSANKLNYLDLIYNQQLVVIDCRNNNFDAQGLNNLFHTLHANPPNITPRRCRIRKTILIGGNPGTRYCERRIARQKGWVVENSR